MAPREGQAHNMQTLSCPDMHHNRFTISRLKKTLHPTWVSMDHFHPTLQSTVYCWQIIFHVVFYFRHFFSINKTLSKLKKHTHNSLDLVIWSIKVTWVPDSTLWLDLRLHRDPGLCSGLRSRSSSIWSIFSSSLGILICHPTSASEDSFRAICLEIQQRHRWDWLLKTLTTKTVWCRHVWDKNVSDLRRRSFGGPIMAIRQDLPWKRTSTRNLASLSFHHGPLKKKLTSFWAKPALNSFFWDCQTMHLIITKTFTQPESLSFTPFISRRCIWRGIKLTPKSKYPQGGCFDHWFFSSGTLNSKKNTGTELL